jgi:hypothetical protein
MNTASEAIWASRYLRLTLVICRCESGHKLVKSAPELFEAEHYRESLELENYIPCVIERFRRPQGT